MRILSSHLKARINKTTHSIEITPQAQASHTEQKKEDNSRVLKILVSDILNLIVIIKKMHWLEDTCRQRLKTGIDFPVDLLKYKDLLKSLSISEVISEVENHTYQLGDFTLVQDFKKNTLTITGDPSQVGQLALLMEKREIKSFPYIAAYQEKHGKESLEQFDLHQEKLKVKESNPPYFYDSLNRMIHVDPKLDCDKMIKPPLNHQKNNPIISEIQMLIDRHTQNLSYQDKIVSKKISDYKIKEEKLKKSKSVFNLSLLFVLWRKNTLIEESRLINTKLNGSSLLKKSLEESNYDFGKAIKGVKTKDLFKHRDFKVIPDELRLRTNTENTFTQIQQLSKQIKVKNKITLFSSQDKKDTGKPSCFLTKCLNP